MRDFSERTSSWRLQVWTQWCSAAWPFGWLVSRVFAERLEQLALALRPLDVAHGMTGQLRAELDADGRPLGTLWHAVCGRPAARCSAGGTAPERRRGRTGRACGVVSPLPRGRLVEPFRPGVGADGSLLLTSGAGRWGSDAEGVLRTDHAIDLWRLPVLRLHHRLDPVEAVPLSARRP